MTYELIPVVLLNLSIRVKGWFRAVTLIQMMSSTGSYNLTARSLQKVFITL